MPMPTPEFTNPNTFTVSLWLRSEVVNVRTPISTANPIGENFQHFGFELLVDIIQLQKSLQIQLLALVFTII